MKRKVLSSCSNNRLILSHANHLVRRELKKIYIFLPFFPFYYCLEFSSSSSSLPFFFLFVVRHTTNINARGLSWLPPVPLSPRLETIYTAYKPIA